MTGTAFATYIRKLTKTNTSTFTDADIVTFANVTKDDIAEQIVANVDENYFDLIIDRNLEADIRDYTLPNNMLKHIKYVAAKLDGTNISYLKQADISHFDTPIMENSYIKEVYAMRKPEFLIQGESIRILSGDDIIAVTDGLTVIAEVYPEDIATGDLTGSTDLSIPSSDTTHALPRPVHKVWAEMVSAEYKQSKDKPIPLTQSEQLTQVNLLEAFKKLSKRNIVNSFEAPVPQYGHGFDY